MPNGLAKSIQKISGLCLGGYLVSWVFDNKFYPILLEKVPEVTERLVYFIIIVPMIVVLSLLASYLLSKIQLVIEKIFSFIVQLIRKNPPHTVQSK